MASGDLRALGDPMGDDVEWVFPGTWAWAGTWSGKAAVVGGLLAPLMRQFASYQLQHDLVLADGDNVVVQAHATATTLRGDRYDQTYLYLVTASASEIVKVVEYCNTALVERVLDPLSPPAN